MADVKISEELFHLLVRVIVDEEGTDEDIRTLKWEISEKQRQMERRRFYKLMHDNSAPADVRAHAKAMYQELSLIHPDYRY